MRDFDTAGTSWAWIAVALLALPVASSCAPQTARRQTDIMEATGQVSVSTQVLRARVNDLVDRLAGRFEQTADQIEAGAETPDVRRRALALKVDVIPTVYTAGFRADPLAAAIDVWVLAFQFTDYVEAGPGRDAFGSQQQYLEETARDLLAEVDAVIKAIVIQPEHFDQVRRRVADWAAEHPIEHAFAARASGAPVLIEMRSDERDVFQDVGAVSDTIENLSERLNTYAAQLPKQARWQAEILATDMLAAIELDRAFADVHDIGTSVDRAATVLDDMPGVISAEREHLTTEVRGIMESFNDQRLDTLEFMTAERIAVIAAARDAVREERTAMLAALQQERIESLVEVDAIRLRAIDASLVALKDLVDYTLWRVAVGVVGLMFTALVMGVLGYQLTLGRRRRTAMS